MCTSTVSVNYRGTLGFGQDNINSLLGHVGDFDVKDCMVGDWEEIGKRDVCLLVGCLTSQQQASVSQGRIC